MDWTIQLLVASITIAFSIAMMLFEFRRNRAKRPISGSEHVMELYYMAYLILLLLGSLFALSAIIR